MVRKGRSGLLFLLILSDDGRGSPRDGGSCGGRTSEENEGFSFVLNAISGRDCWKVRREKIGLRSDIETSKEVGGRGSGRSPEGARPTNERPGFNPPDPLLCFLLPPKKRHLRARETREMKSTSKERSETHFDLLRGRIP